MNDSIPSGRRELSPEQRARLEVLDSLVSTWWTFPDAAEELGLRQSQIRSWVRDRLVLAVRRGERLTWQIPADCFMDGAPLLELKGTINVLSDAGLADDEALVWLFTEDETLPGSPVAALRRGHKAEIRRRAQALAIL